MKTLKFIHGLADDIRQGIKTTTWRINDNQNISVNDELELIDQVDKQDPKTWTIIGVARVEAVLEKRFRDVGQQDLDGHRIFESQDEMLRAYSRYAEHDVTLDTPIKIIHFQLLPKNTPADSVVNISSLITEVKLYADGGSRGNPGPSATGFVILNMNDEVLVRKGSYLGVTTNNQAEYQALKFGLEEALHMGSKQVHVFMDSMLVVNQMMGRFKVKNRDLWPIHNEITELVTRFRKVSFTQVPRELNKLADAMVNEALDSAASRQ